MRCKPGRHHPLCWVREHPLFLWFVLLAIVVAVAAGLLQHNQQSLAREQRARVAALEMEQAARVHDQCLASVDGRQVLQAVVVAATAPSLFDVSTLPVYTRLDPATQELFRELADLERSAAGPTAERRAALLDKIPVPDCGPKP